MAVDAYGDYPQLFIEIIGVTEEAMVDLS